ncbi:hypothetical protein [Sulfitobacter sabulilitoris]|uniref:DUF7742 domain-containing protein n=1 Tax=Sulfitobacter sabulilitoris TaxID=2562655 RepID=A0A5S3PL82_9RHOB|nr:hypothetical protein [Sulfitobacter sabulilitoris]TMM54320.1 hypothetical protein FDT80_01610 [Sulfitobacter sabulilitoris]
MRPLMHGDITHAARALLAVPRLARVHVCGDLMRRADWADCYRKRLGRPHPSWGNGTLAAAARSRPIARERTLDDLEYCRCVALVLAGIMARKQVRAARCRG